MSIPEHLRKGFFGAMKDGGETKAKEFLIDNLKELPEEVQDAIIIKFVQEAVEQKVSDDTLISNFQKEMYEAINTLEKGKEKTEKQIKLASLKKEL